MYRHLGRALLVTHRQLQGIVCLVFVLLLTSSFYLVLKWHRSPDKHPQSPSDLGTKSLKDRMSIQQDAASLRSYQPVDAVKFFGISSHRQITWAHAINSKEKLQAAIASTTMMLEADVIISIKNSTPVMAHPPTTDSDLTLAEFLKTTLTGRKGIKLDFKTLDAVRPALQILKSVSNDFSPVPILLNADILVPPCTYRTSVNAYHFTQYCTELFPEADLSLGWVPHISAKHHIEDCHPEGHLRWEIVKEMADLCEPLKQSVTFPVSIRAARKNIDQLRWLLGQSSRYSLTLWTYPNDDISVEELVFIYKSLLSEKVYYDLDHLENKLNEQLPSELKFRHEGWKGI